MKTSILASKTGQRNMGGYIAEKTALVFTYSFESFSPIANKYRFKYAFDSYEECFDTLTEAMERFNEAVKTFI